MRLKTFIKKKQFNTKLVILRKKKYNNLRLNTFKYFFHQLNTKTILNKNFQKAYNTFNNYFYFLLLLTFIQKMLNVKLDHNKTLSLKSRKFLKLL